MAILRRPSKSPRLMKSRKQEATIASETGGKVTPGSGNRWHAKGDVSEPQYLIEAKRTDAKSFVLKSEELIKITFEAMAAGKEPVMHVQIGKMDVAVIPWYLFRQLTNTDKETT